MTFLKKSRIIFFKKKKLYYHAYLGEQIRYFAWDRENLGYEVEL